jgi:hypothetical protein
MRFRLAPPGGLRVGLGDELFPRAVILEDER